MEKASETKEKTKKTVRKNVVEKNDILEEQANKILELAKEYGAEKNFLFVTTFDRYMTQIATIAKIKKAMSRQAATVTKEYVKGRKNIYCNPLISEFNKSTDSANRTAQTLIKIITGVTNVNGETKKEDPLFKILDIK